MNRVRLCASPMVQEIVRGAEPARDAGVRQNWMEWKGEFLFTIVSRGRFHAYLLQDVAEPGSGGRARVPRPGSAPAAASRRWRRWRLRSEPAPEQERAGRVEAEQGTEGQTRGGQ